MHSKTVRIIYYLQLVPACKGIVNIMNIWKKEIGSESKQNSCLKIDGNTMDGRSVEEKRRKKTHNIIWLRETVT